MVPKGSYTLYTVPSDKDWQLVISKKTGQWGIPYPGKEFDLVRPVSDPVVAEEVLASDHPRQRLELLVSDLHPPREHGGLRPGARGRAAVAREPEPVGLDRHVRILDVWRPQKQRAWSQDQLATRAWSGESQKGAK